MVFILDPEDEDLPVDSKSAGVFRHYDPRPSQELQQLTEEFLANGGHITHLEPTSKHKPLPSRRELMVSEYNARKEKIDRRDRWRQESAEAKMVVDDIPKVVAIREELARGTRGMQKVADAVGLTKRVVERLTNVYNLPVRRYCKKQGESA